MSVFIFLTSLLIFGFFPFCIGYRMGYSKGLRGERWKW